MLGEHCISFFCAFASDFAVYRVISQVMNADTAEAIMYPTVLFQRDEGTFSSSVTLLSIESIF